MSGEIIQMDELEEGQEEKPDTEVFLDIPVYQEIVAEWERAKKFKGIIESKNVGFYWKVSIQSFLIQNICRSLQIFLSVFDLQGGKNSFFPKVPQ